MNVDDKRTRIIESRRRRRWFVVRNLFLLTAMVLFLRALIGERAFNNILGALIAVVVAIALHVFHPAMHIWHQEHSHRRR